MLANVPAPSDPPASPTSSDDLELSIDALSLEGRQEDDCFASIPAEIVADTFEAATAEDEIGSTAAGWKTAMALRLCCRRFEELIRPAFFSQWRISRSPDQMQATLEILRVNPSIWSLIRSLAFDLDGSFLGRIEALAARLSEVAPPNLESVSFRLKVDAAYASATSSALEYFIVGLSLMPLPRLRELAISVGLFTTADDFAADSAPRGRLHAESMLQLFASAPRLAALILEEVDIADLEGGERWDTLRPVKLERMEIMMSAIGDQFGRYLARCVRHIERLELCYNQSVDVDVELFLAAAQSPNVKWLQFFDPVPEAAKFIQEELEPLLKKRKDLRLLCDASNLVIADQTTSA